MNSGADNPTRKPDFTVQEANTLVKNHDGSENTPIGVNERPEQRWQPGEGFGTVPKTNWQRERWSVRQRSLHGLLTPVKPWGTLDPPIPPSRAHRLSLDKEDSSAPLPVNTRGLEARDTGDVHAELGAKGEEGQAVPEAKVSAAAFLEKFNNPLTKIEQEQLKMYALQNPRDNKSLTRMVKRLVGLTEKLARGQKKASKKLKEEEEEAETTVKQEDTPSLSELAVDWARENKGEQKEVRLLL